MFSKEFISCDFIVRYYTEYVWDELNNKQEAKASSEAWKQQKTKVIKAVVKENMEENKKKQKEEEEKEEQKEPAKKTARTFISPKINT
ncbi:hypothetical protein EOD39_17512 [Acipenser ruthenus]|uniref:Uncharacterized protein n=1 Tax=Acipenser ruthenus TaxID=7906 RepID=A0A444U731_ACIRT|nr:hypothetical protein EOD39_17512 [Acipenser ruthenus]